MKRIDDMRANLTVVGAILDDVEKAYNKSASAKNHEEMVDAHSKAHAALDTAGQELVNMLAAAQAALDALVKES